MVDSKKILNENKKLREENRKLRKELLGRPPNKKWVIKTEELKSDIPNYNSQILLIITFIVMFATIKTDPTFLKVVLIVSLLLIICLTWNRDKKKDQLAKHFGEGDIKSPICKCGLNLLGITPYILLGVFILSELQCIFFIMVSILILYLILQVVLWLKYRKSPKKRYS